MITCSEPTLEGLVKLFAVGHPSLGIFSAEGGQFIGGHGMNDEAKLRTAAGLPDAWDGVPIKRVRGGDGSIVLPGRRLSMHLMVQPAVAEILFRDPLLTDQGLLSRMLITGPDSAAGTRLWREPSNESDTALKRYGARLLSLLEAPPPLRADTTNELEPRLLQLSTDARNLWTKFADHIEHAIAPAGEFEPVRGLANKLPEHAARLARVLTLVRDLHAGEICPQVMLAGIVLAEHYATEALRLFGAAQISEHLQLAQRLLNWMRTTWSEPYISLPDIYQLGPNAIRDKATAAKMVDILEDHGFLVKVLKGADVAGKHRRDAWQIIRGRADGRISQIRRRPASRNFSRFSNFSRGGPPNPKNGRHRAACQANFSRFSNFSGGLSSKRKCHQ
jgi:hypothetical protein